MLAREEHISRRKMTSTGGLSQDEKKFRDLVFSMAEMVKVPNLRTCLALRWGAQLADVPCITLGRPTLGRLY